MEEATCYFQNGFDYSMASRVIFWGIVSYITLNFFLVIIRDFNICLNYLRNGSFKWGIGSVTLDFFLVIIWVFISYLNHLRTNFLMDVVKNGRYFEVSS